VLIFGRVLAMRSSRTEGFLMHVGDVREVAQVVVDEHVTGLVVDATRPQRPLRIVETDRCRDQRGVASAASPIQTQTQLCGLRWIASHAGALWNGFLSGNLDAAAGRLELEP